MQISRELHDCANARQAAGGTAAEQCMAGPHIYIQRYHITCSSRLCADDKQHDGAADSQQHPVMSSHVYNQFRCQLAGSIFDVLLDGCWQPKCLLQRAPWLDTARVANCTQKRRIRNECTS